MTTMTPETFAVDELDELGIAPTPGDVEVVTAWETGEGGHWHNHAWYNPLDTTLVFDGSQPIDGNPNQNNGHPVQAYRSWQDGLAATAETLAGTKNSQGVSVYEPILDALAANDPTRAAQAIVDSPWGTHSLTYAGKTYTRGGMPAGGTATGGGASSQSSGVQPAGLGGAKGWNPLKWPGQIAGHAASDLWGQLQPFLTTAMFAVGGVALVVLGGKQLVQPTIDKAENSVDTAAKAAGTAAML